MMNFFALEQDLLKDLDDEAVAGQHQQQQNMKRQQQTNPVMSSPQPNMMSSPVNNTPPQRDFNSSSGVGAQDVDKLLGSLGMADDPAAHISPEDEIYSFIHQMPPSPLGVCHRCQKACVSDFITLGDRSYHILHYVCAGCGVRLKTESYYPMVRGEIICYKCEKSVEEKKKRLTSELGIRAPPANTGRGGGMVCGACSGPIGGGFLEAMGKLWHNNCFRCGKCNDDLLGMGIGGKFFPKDGKPFCQSCYSKSLSFQS